MKETKASIFSVVGGEAEHQIDRKELQEKINRLELYFNRVYTRLEELDTQLQQARSVNTEEEAIITEGLKEMQLRSQKETMR